MEVLSAPAQVTEIDQTEAYRALCDLARRRTGAIPTDLLVRQVLATTAGADWPVQRAAMEALLRRIGFAHRDGLRIAERPAGREVLGLYTTRRQAASMRPYFTLLTSFAPLAGSCDCADFVRSSLGLCKHLLVVLEDVATSQHKLQRAAKEQAALTAGCAMSLRWDPVRPLTGPGDWLQRLRWYDGGAGRHLGKCARALRQRFERRGGEKYWRIATPHLADPTQRAQIVTDLLDLMSSDKRAPDRSAADWEPALPALLHAEHERLARARDCAEIGGAIERSLRALKLALYPYQVEGVRRFFESGRLLLADDMGLGKTAQAIAICQVLWTAGAVRRGLLIVPASLKPQWLREWQNFSKIPVTVVDGGPAERQKTYRTAREGFLVANYEQVLRDLPLMHKWRPELVVLDEAQRIKNWATKTATYVKRLEPRFRLVLTGTPMENRLDELASILDWVDDTALEPKWRLAPWHATHVDGTREISGARNLDTLRTRLQGCLVRRVRREVLEQLPPRTDTRVSVELTEAQREEHDALNQSIAQLVGRGRRRPLSQPEFLKLMSLLTMQRIFCNGMAQANFDTVWPTLEKLGRPTPEVLAGLCSPKLGELRELVANAVVAQERKAVIFSQWRRMLRLAHWAVSDLLDAAGLRAVFFTGDEGQKRRTQNLVDLHDDPRTAILFATDAGGVGLNLQRAASCCINLELPWNPAVLEQRIGRIYRIGQELPIDVYHLVTEQGIESRIADLVADKRALFVGLFDGDSDQVAFDSSGSFLSKIEKIVEPIQVPELTDADEVDDDLAADGAGNGDQEVAATPPLIETPAPPVPPVLDAASAPAGLLAAGPVAAPAVVTPAAIGELFKQIQIRPAASGTVVIEAPVEAASSLAAIFEGMARMLSALQPPGRPQD